MHNYSSRRINKLAEKFNSQTYLEIAALNGHSFFDVNIKKKTAVDPYFRFNKSEYESEQSQFFELVSDIFFLNLAPHIKYDLIFFNHIHIFEDTFRDFTNSFVHSHEKTIWLFNNTYPHDVFSTLKKQKEAANARQQAGLKGVGWHGDVYKLVFAIHDFFPALSYCTINTGRNPQTLVWYGKRVLMPRFDSFEAISRLDYFTLQEHLDLMVFKPEDQAINFVGNSLKPEHFVTN